ncbi:FAD-dependent oxidoreductase [Pseudonocardia sp. HH130630-07]|uniref:FAD-dependent oxidoreductase n=1 Tax=Pseudonocardia sp. HH130630-07 TaxID=1690815 RepID=UPI0008150F13|nr:FAD-dependent oxidoreductase [Pseudonocardia sp. HH130630-07]ANY07665.1 hypothetical protein AFB00_16710 [Pseudonocardia sp. HH130630-07]
MTATLVVGAGIAGCAVARVLRRRGLDVTIVERRLEPPRSGTALNLPGNAVRALRSLGIDAGPHLSAFPIRRREYRSATDRLLFSVDEAGFWSGVAESWCVSHAELGAELARGLDVRFGTRVLGIDDGAGDGPSTVTFEDGTRRSYDLVVGADGIRSVVRGIVSPAVPAPSVMTPGSWRLVTADPGVEHWTAWTGRRGTFLLIPMGGGRAYGYASTSRGEPVDTDPEWLRRTFGGFPRPVRETVGAVLAGDGRLHHAPVEELRTDRWHRGGVVVVGDAAHATGPVWAQGAAMALEDAVVLGETMALPGTTAEKLDRWERRRRPRVEHVQAATDRMSRIAALPDRLLRLTTPLAGPRSYRAAYRPLRATP